jgi:hypothetical protein
MPKNAQKHTPAPPAKPTRKQLQVMLLQAGQLVEAANREINVTNDRRQRVEGLNEMLKDMLSRLRSDYVTDCEKLLGIIRQQVEMIDEQRAKIEQLQKLSNRLDLYHHNSQVALAAMQQACPATAETANLY